MAKKIKCWVCGALHDYCPTCGQTHGWRYVADTIEHYQLYITLEDYHSGVITKEQAAKIFAEKCGVRADDDLSWMYPVIEKRVREIIGDKGKEIVKTTRKSKLYKNE